MADEAPPCVLACERVIAYAIVGPEVAFTGTQRLYVDGKLLGRVPRLAICHSLVEPDRGPDLLHCDDEWSVLGCSGSGTVEEIKRSAENHYAGISSAWIHLDTSVEEALAYFDNEFARCSFCGKRAFEVEGGLACAETAAICRGCVDAFHANFAASDSVLPPGEE